MTEQVRISLNSDSFAELSAAAKQYKASDEAVLKAFHELNAAGHEHLNQVVLSSSQRRDGWAHGSLVNAAMLFRRNPAAQGKVRPAEDRATAMAFFKLAAATVEQRDRGLQQYLQRHLVPGNALALPASSSSSPRTVAFTAGQREVMRLVKVNDLEGIVSYLAQGCHHFLGFDTEGRRVLHVKSNDSEVELRLTREFDSQALHSVALHLSGGGNAIELPKEFAGLVQRHLNR